MVKTIGRISCAAGLGLWWMVVGCACHPVQVYRPADNLITEASYRMPEGMDSLVTDTATLAELNWHAYYADSLLQALIGEALQANFDVKLACLRVEEARAYYDRSRKALLPAASVGLSGRLYKESEPLTGNPRSLMQDYVIGVGAEWEADLWGKLKSGKRAALARLGQEEATHRAVKTRVVADVAWLYFQLMTLDAKREVVEKTIRVNEDYLKSLEQVSNRSPSHKPEVKAPAVAPAAGDEWMAGTSQPEVNRQTVAVAQAHAEIYAARSYLPEVETAVFVLENTLNLMLGRPGGEIPRAKAHHGVANSGLPDWMGTGIPAQLLAERPDVAAAEMNLRAAFELENVARAAFYPSLRLNGMLGVEGTRMYNWFDLPSSLIWNALAGLTQPLFRRGELQTEQRIGRLRRKGAFVEFRREVLTAQSEVSNALMRYRAGRERARMVYRQYLSLRHAFEYSVELLPKGETTYLDVLAAQRRVFDTEMKLYDCVLEVLRQKIELYRALGGGWRG